MRRNQAATQGNGQLQDRTGNRYEVLLSTSLEHLGYHARSDEGKNYVRPGRGRAVEIPGTFIQPDLIVRNGTKIVAILYATHWSETRSSKKKFWRTWEEAAQQKAVLGNNLLTVNCIFEALPGTSEPIFLHHSEELPNDPSRNPPRPLQLRGWDPGVGWAMIEAFDTSLIFPVQYSPPQTALHDLSTTQLLDQALSHGAKPYFFEQWDSLRDLRTTVMSRLPTLADTRSRYRIGLLHTYLLYRVANRVLDKATPPLGALIRALTSQSHTSIEVAKLAQDPVFASVALPDLQKWFHLLTTVPVRSGTNPAYLCNVTQSIVGERIAWNNDLRLCLNDLRQHLDVPGFLDTIGNTFLRFDTSFGIADALDDLANADNVAAKEAFVRSTFVDALSDADALSSLLQTHAKYISHERMFVSPHSQNWVFEMLVSIARLNTVEDIQTRFQTNFEASGHKLRPHAPWGNLSAVIHYCYEGIDLCSQWGKNSARRTLQPDEFQALVWQAVAQSISEAFAARGGIAQDSAVVVKRYIESKARRIISSDLNGYHILIEQYLADLCHLRFTRDDAEPDEQAEGGDGFGEANCHSWQTDVIQTLWGGRPLETRFEGMSHNGRWLIKVQSAQDGNEGHKTKELAGRCRGIRLAWQHGTDPFNRAEWHFASRSTRKLALVLDGDWSALQKQNLYEAGWNWVGDVAQLAELRSHIETA